MSTGSQDKFFLKMSLPWQLVAAVVAAGALWAVGTQTKMFGSGYATISRRGGLYLFGCFLVLIVIDRYRQRDGWEIRTDRVWAS